MKSIAVLVAGSGQLHDLQIQPATTAGDVLRSIGLSDYVLSLDNDSPPVPSNEEIYTRVKDGQKLYCSTEADAGAGQLAPALDQILMKIGLKSNVQVQGTRQTTAVQTRKKRPVVVIRSKIPIWQEKGWRQEGNRYRGFYSSNGNRCHGEIQNPYPGELRMFIYRPPKTLERHPHWACFQFVGNDWYELHFSRKPNDVDSAILLMEQLIREVN